MKVNDIVEVQDRSWSLALVKGNMRHTELNSLRGRRFRLLAVGGTYPTDDCDRWIAVSQNDTMAVDCNDPDTILFTQERFCHLVTPAPPE